MGITADFNIVHRVDTNTVNTESANSVNSASTKTKNREEIGYRSVIDFVEISLSGLYKAVQDYSEKSLDNKETEKPIPINESIDYSRENILNSSDEAMSAQANQNNLDVLYLLQ